MSSSRPLVTNVPSLILVVNEDPQIHQVVGHALTPRDARDILRAGAAPTVVILADHFRKSLGSASRNA